MKPEDYDAAVDIVKKQRDSAVMAAEEAKLVCREVLAMARLSSPATIKFDDRWGNLVEMARKVIG